MAIDVVGRVAQVATDSALNASVFSAHTSPSAQDAVPTDLPAPETVQATPKSSALPLDDAQQARAAIQSAPANSYIKSKFVYDRKDDLVFISVDELTGAVVEKFPDDAVLRETIYQQAAAPTQSDSHLVEKVA